MKGIVPHEEDYVHVPQVKVTEEMIEAENLRQIDLILKN